MSWTPVTLKTNHLTPAHSNLFNATALGNLGEVRKILQSNPGIDLTLPEQENGFIPLTVAIINGRTEVAKFLLEANSSVVNRQGKWGETPLKMAVVRRNTEMVQSLLAANANSGLKDQNGVNALMDAVRKGFSEIIKILLDTPSKLDINDQDNDGYSALHWAISGQENIQAVQILLTAKVNIDLREKEGYSALMLAARKGYVQTVKVLLEADPKPNVNLRNNIGATALMWAAQDAQLQTLQMLLDAGADASMKNDEGASALTFAIETDNPAALQILLKAKIDINQGVNERGDTPLMFAISRKRLQAFKYLLEAGADVTLQNKGGFTALISAAARGGTAVVWNKAKMPEKQRDKEIGKPIKLDKPADKVHLEIIRLLKSTGKVNILQKTNEGYTALMIAVCMDHPEAIPELLQDNIDFRNNDGRTALMMAALQKCSSEVLPILLGANPKPELDLQDKEGWTALIFAASSNQPEQIQALLKAKADVNLADKNGMTPLMFALGLGNAEAADLLIEQKETNIFLKNVHEEDSYHLLLNITTSKCSSESCELHDVHRKARDKTFLAKLILKKIQYNLEKENQKHVAPLNLIDPLINLNRLKDLIEKLLQKDKTRECLGFAENYILKVKADVLIQIANSSDRVNLKNRADKYSEKWLHIPFARLAHKLSSTNVGDMAGLLLTLSFEYPEIELDLEKSKLAESLYSIDSKMNKMEDALKKERARLGALEKELSKLQQETSRISLYFFEEASLYCAQAQGYLEQAECELFKIEKFLPYVKEKMSYCSEGCQPLALIKAGRAMKKLEALDQSLSSSLKEVLEYRTKLQNTLDGMEKRVQELKSKQERSEQAYFKKLKKLEGQQERKNEYEAEIAREQENTRKLEQEKLNQLIVEKEASQKRREEWKIRQALEKQLVKKKVPEARPANQFLPKEPLAESRRRHSKRGLDSLTRLGSRLEGLEAIKKLKYAFGVESKDAKEDREVRVIERDALLGAIAETLEEIKNNKSSPIPFEMAQLLRNFLYHYPQLIGESVKELIALRQLVLLLNEKLQAALEQGVRLEKGIHAVQGEDLFLAAFLPLGSKEEYQEGFKLLGHWLVLARECQEARKSGKSRRSLKTDLEHIKQGEIGLARCAKETGLDNQVLNLAERYNYACLGAQASELMVRLGKGKGRLRKHALDIHIMLQYISLGKEIRHPKSKHHDFLFSVFRQTNNSKEENNKDAPSSKQDDKPDSSRSSGKQNLLFSFPSARIHDVSGQGNNCGLFALTLGVRLAFEGNPKLKFQSELSTLLGSISKEALQLGTRETRDIRGEAREELSRETTAAGMRLREELRAALSRDLEYRQRRFTNFVSLGVDRLANRPLAADMNSFVKANASVLEQLEPSWKICQELLKSKIYEETEALYQSYIKSKIPRSEIVAFKKEISAVVLSREAKGVKELLEQYHLKLAGSSKDALHALIELHRLFHTACQGVNEGTPLDRASLRDRVDELLLQKFLDILNRKEIEDNPKEQLKSLLLYALSRNTSFNEKGVPGKISDKQEVISSVMSLFVQRQVNHQWDHVYKKYCDYLKTSQEFLTADELGCLARHWGVQLKIQFATGTPYKTYADNPNPELLHVTLCNPSQTHWNVISEGGSTVGQEKVVELLGKIEDIGFKKRLIETIKNKEAYERRKEDYSYLQGFLSVIEDWVEICQKQGAPLSESDTQLIKQLSALFEEAGIWKINAEAVYQLAEPLEKFLKAQGEVNTAETPAKNQAGEENPPLIFSEFGKPIAPKSQPGKRFTVKK